MYVSGGAAIPGLQCLINECDGICVHAVSLGVHVPSHPTTTYMYGISRTGGQFIHNKACTYVLGIDVYLCSHCPTDLL